MQNIPKGRGGTGVLAAALILTAAFAVRIGPVLRESIGGDETFTVQAVAQPMGKMLRAARDDLVTPPLHAVLLKCWRALVGSNLSALRAFSLAAGLAVVMLTIILGRRLFPDGRIGLLAGGLVALNELQMFSSYYVRHYSFYAALVLLLMIMAGRALRDPSVRWPWAAFAAIAVVLVNTHYVGWLFILGTLPAVFAARRAQALRRWLISVGLAFLAFLPWAVVVYPVFRERGTGMNLTWVPPTTAKSLVDAVAGFGGMPVWAGGAWIPVTVSLGLMAAALYGLFAKPNRVPPLQSTRAGLLLGGSAILVPLLLFAVAIPPLKLPYWHVRHLIPAQAAFALLLCYGLFVLARSSRAVLVLGAAVLLGLQAMLTMDEVIGFRFEPYNRVAACLREGPRVPGRLVVLPPRGAEYLSYYPGPSREAMGWPRTAPDESRLPPTLWLVYRPAKEEDAALAQRLIDRGYVLQRSAVFMKRPSDVHGLRLVLLQKQSR